MPTTLLSLVLFVVLLVPGFAYTLRRERLTSARSISTFRETVSLAFVSIVADTIVLLIFALLRAVVPAWTPDVGALVRAPGQYAQVHYAELIGWSAGLLVIATMLATAAAGGWQRRIAERLGRRRAAEPMREHEAYLSGWALLFSENPGTLVHLGCFLDDGSYVAGRLRSYSRAADDVADRELTLTGPIVYRAPEGKAAAPLSDVGAAAISARHLVLLTVSYEPLDS